MSISDVMLEEQAGLPPLDPPAGPTAGLGPPVHYCVALDQKHAQQIPSNDLRTAMGRTTLLLRMHPYSAGDTSAILLNSIMKERLIQTTRTYSLLYKKPYACGSRVTFVNPSSKGIRVCALGVYDRKRFVTTTTNGIKHVDESVRNDNLLSYKTHLKKDFSCQK